MLYQHRAVVGKNAQHAARLATISAREHLDRIVAMNIQTRHLLLQLSAISRQLSVRPALASPFNSAQKAES
jgi:hypothetical protein